MGLIKKIAERAAGAAKARSDIELVKQFIDEHHGKVPPEIAKRFFASLEEAAPPYGSEAGKVYKKMVNQYIATDPEIARLFPQAPAIAAGKLAAGAMVMQITIADLIKALPNIVPLLTTQEIDQIEAEHGHEPGESCEMIDALRLRRQRADEEGGN